MMGMCPHLETAKKPSYRWNVPPHGDGFDMHPAMRPDDGMCPHLKAAKKTPCGWNVPPHGGGSDIHPAMRPDDGTCPYLKAAKKTPDDRMRPYSETVPTSTHPYAMMMRFPPLRGKMRSSADGIYPHSKDRVCTLLNEICAPAWKC